MTYWHSSICREFREPAVCHLFPMGFFHANNGYSTCSIQPVAENPVLYDFIDKPPAVKKHRLDFPSNSPSYLNH